MMRRSLWIDLFKLLGFFGLLWVIFIIWNPDFTGEGSFELSIDKEEKLGKLMLDNIINDDTSFNEIDSPEIDSVLHIITSRLLNNMEVTEYEYNFVLVRNDLVNAFTLPGGNIVIFSGLIDFTEQPEELAAVMAHEIGHVEYRHVVKKLIREFGITLITSILTGGDAVLINELGRSIVSATFSRNQEREADQYGLQLLEWSGIRPTAMASLFRRMNRENLDYNENLEIIMSHPHNNARIKSSLEYQVQDSFMEEPFEIDWDRIKESL